MAKIDIIKMSVTVLMINLMVIFLYEGMMMEIKGVDETIIASKLTSLIGETEKTGEKYVEKTGVVLKDIGKKEDCDNFGGVWDGKRKICYDALTKSSDINFDVFDIFGFIFKIPEYIKKVITLIASILFFYLILSLKISPLIPWVEARFLLNVALISYQAFNLYLIWGLISNWRGSRW